MKSLTEIFNLTGNSEIPRDIEDVTLTSLKRLLNQTIQLNSNLVVLE